MAKTRDKTGRFTSSEADRVRKWSDRVALATKAYQAWEKRHNVKRLEQYWLGEQWQGATEEDAQKKYTINLVFPTVETTLPGLLFDKPQVIVSAKPGHSDDPGSEAPARAQLAQDTLQTFIDNKDVHFKDQTGLALREAFYRFGMVEVGYSADYIDNPNMGKPVLKEDGTEPLRGSDGEPVLQADKTLKSQQVYVKRIPAAHFRVNAGAGNVLDTNDWVGYFEWQYVEDVKRNPTYPADATKELKGTGQLRDVVLPSDDEGKTAGEQQSRGDMVKIWKIWDLRQRKRYVFAEGSDTFLIEGKPFKFSPFAGLKFYEILDAWYPLPPVKNWLGPQDEINESREMQRTHRKRFTRRYTMKKGNIDTTELEKLESGEDGVYATSNVDKPLEPVPDAPLDASIWTHLGVTHDDFREISGVGGDARGIPQSETATQANIINIKQQLRDSRTRVDVRDWLAQIARLLLLTIIDQMQGEFWVKISGDPANPEAQAQAFKGWQQLKGEDLKDLDFDVSVDLASLSPVAEDAERAGWMQVITLLSNPALLTLLMTPNPTAPDQPSPLLRKTLRLFGVKREQEIQEIARIGQAALTQMHLQQALAAAGGGQAMLGPGGSGPGDPMTAPAPAAGRPVM